MKTFEEVWQSENQQAKVSNTAHIFKNSKIDNKNWVFDIKRKSPKFKCDSQSVPL